MNFFKYAAINAILYLILSFGFFLNEPLYQNLSASLLSIFSIWLIVKYSTEKNLNKYFLLTPIIINLTFIVAALIAGKDLSFFANFDTINNFYPKAEWIAKTVLDNRALNMPTGWADRFLIFDLINAPIIYTFGRNEFIFMCLLGLYKLIAGLFIFKATKELISEECAKIAICLYFFNPLYIVHSAYIFKESWVQMIFSIYVFSVIKFSENSKKLKYFGVLIIVGSICIWERIYLILPVLTSVVFITIYRFRTISGAKVLALFCTFVSVLFFTSKLLIDPQQIFVYLKSTREFYSSYSDVSQGINYQIGYFWGFIKLLFSPYPNFRKLELFNGISLVIFWASFFGVGLTISMLLGMFKTRDKIYTKIFLLSFFLFVAFLSYITPYGFRQRDSLAIFYVMFSAVYLLPMIRKIKLHL